MSPNALVKDSWVSNPASSAFGNGFAGELQVSRGALQPQASNVLLQRLANESPENAVKMKAGEGRDPRHLVQFQIVIQMLLDVHERSDDALAIVLFGGWLHRRASHSAPTRALRSPILPGLENSN